MKYFTKASLLIAAGLISLLPIFLTSQSATAAGTATLSLSPSSSTIAQGTNRGFGVDIYEDSGTDNVNAVQANLSFSSNLSVGSIDTTGSAFSITAESSISNGSIRIGRGTTTPVSGKQLIASISVSAPGTGTGTINFTAGSAVVRSSDNGSEALTLNGGTYIISSPATMTLSPATKTVNQGDSFDVDVYENSGGDTVNAVQANLSYPSSLTFVSSTPNTSAWPIEAQNTASGNVVKIGRGTTAPLTGSQLIATVRFTAASAGNAQVAFASGSGVIRSTDNTAEPSTNTGGTYTINAPASTPPASGGGSSTPPPSGTTKKTTSAPAPPKTYTTAPATGAPPVTAPADTTAPEITDVTVTNLTSASATINWKTSEPATSEVDYGLNTDFILSKSDATLTTNHSLVLDPKVLAPHKTFHFVVKSADAAGNLATSEDQTFHTGGLYIDPNKAVIVGGGAAVIVGGGLVIAKIAGLLKFGAMTASAGGLYSAPKATGKTPPKPIIVGGGAPPPPPQPIIKPQANPAAATPKAEDAQAPGEVIAPKAPPK